LRSSLKRLELELKRLELEKELDRMRRAQLSEYHGAIETRTTTPIRDAATGEMGLMMRNGEVMTPEKITRRMEIAAKCLETLQTSETHNRKLIEENKTLKQSNEMIYAEMRRLERLLSGFERARKFDHFTDDLQRQAVERNEQLAAEVERLERTVHTLQEENAVLKQQHRRQSVCAPRARVEDDGGGGSIVSYITSDGRVPPSCPCDAEGCEERYETQVIGSESPTEAFVIHMSKMHKVRCFPAFVAYPTNTTPRSASTASSSSRAPSTSTRARAASRAWPRSPGKRLGWRTTKSKADRGWRIKIAAVKLDRMLCPLLHSVDARLDTILAPPYPQTQDDRASWCFRDPEDRSPSFYGPDNYSPPSLPQWIPPQGVPPSEDTKGFYLAPRVICYQRTYEPPTLYDQFTKVAAGCFHPQSPSKSEILYNLERLAFDFFIVVLASNNTPAAGCVVEFRPAIKKRMPPYLYVSTVCTDPEYSSRGLAHQLIHAVYTLGALMLQQNETAPGMWQNAIPAGRLDLGLAVMKQPIEIAVKLQRLYGQCGLILNKGQREDITYKSFTPYSIYQWQLENESEKLSMWQTITQHVLYDDGDICILHPTRTQEGITMYHCFPGKKMRIVQSNGIVHQKHAVLHENPGEIYAPSTIRFNKQGIPTQGVFCIQAETAMETVELRISIPPWFASRISFQDAYTTF
jgi:hypothetical protein